MGGRTEEKGESEPSMEHVSLLPGCGCHVTSCLPTGFAHCEGLQPPTVSPEAPFLTGVVSCQVFGHSSEERSSRYISRLTAVEQTDGHWGLCSKAVQGTSKTELGSVAMVNKELTVCMKRRVTYCHLLIQW